MARERQEYAVNPAPCGSCPYRKDTPSGVWHQSEYAKLTEFSKGFDLKTGEGPCVAVFLCHQTKVVGADTVCRGWLTVEAESVAVKLMLAREEITYGQVHAEPLVPLYATGAEAAVAGMKAVLRPSRAAKKMSAALVKKGAGKWDEDVKRGRLRGSLRGRRDRS